jgi:hypothetical protein
MKSNKKPVSNTNAENNKQQTEISVETMKKELGNGRNEVEKNQISCKPCNYYDGINLIELDREVKWVKTTSLKLSFHHLEFYSLVPILDNALIKSIINKGVIAPLLITSNHIIISGVMRFMVALVLKLEVVPVIYDTNDELNGQMAA